VDFDRAATSIGIVVADASLSDRTEFLQDADVALYEAKRLGKGRFAFFTTTMHQQAVNQFTLVQELRQALQSGSLAMHYQPIFDLTDEHIVGSKRSCAGITGRGWIPPNVFIPAAEQSELILELGHFAIRQALAACARGNRPATTRAISL